MLIKRYIALSLIPFVRLTSVSATIHESINTPTIWSGRIEVSTTVTVTSGADLTIRPGTQVLFHKRAGLVVEGRLTVEFEPEYAVEFRPAEGVSPGEWLGIVIDPQKRETPSSRLTGCHIQGATVGITLSSDAASPHVVADCQVYECSEAGILLDGVTAAFLEKNQVRACGENVDAHCGGILLTDARYCTVANNSVSECRRYGIVATTGGKNTIKSNVINRITGKSQSTEGTGISIQRGSDSNLILCNSVTHCNYNGIIVYSRDNQVIGNDIGESPDCLGLAGGDCRGNVIRNNRISRGWWSTLYVTSTARDNFLCDNIVEGGDGGITTRAAGPNLWENCHFYHNNSNGQIALMGTGIATFRRCTLNTKSPCHLSLEYASHARVIDCNFDKQRVQFGEGTTNDNFVEWLHTVELTVVDRETMQPISGASVQFRSGTMEGEEVSVTTEANGRATAEVIETIIRKDRNQDVSPYRVTISAPGYQTQEIAAVKIDQPLSLDVDLCK